MQLKTLITTGIIVSFIFCLPACKKDKNDQQKEFLILEDYTSTPVADAIVEAYKCSSKDWLGNCSVVGPLLGTTTTDKDGKAFFPASLEVGTLRIKKDKYWPTENINTGFLGSDTHITPIATLRVHIIRENQYPSGYLLNITGQPEGCNDCIWETKQLSQPLDTIVYLKGGGYYQNTVGWYMNPGGPANGHSTPPVLVNRFDTARYEIRY